MIFSPNNASCRTPIASFSSLSSENSSAGNSSEDDLLPKSENRGPAQHGGQLGVPALQRYLKVSCEEELLRTSCLDGDSLNPTGAAPPSRGGRDTPYDQTGFPTSISMEELGAIDRSDDVVLEFNGKANRSHTSVRDGQPKPSWDTTRNDTPYSMSCERTPTVCSSGHHGSGTLIEEPQLRVNSSDDTENLQAMSDYDLQMLMDWQLQQLDSPSATLPANTVDSPEVPGDDPIPLLRVLTTDSGISDAERVSPLTSPLVRISRCPEMETFPGQQRSNSGESGLTAVSKSSYKSDLTVRLSRQSSVKTVPPSDPLDCESQTDGPAPSPTGPAGNLPHLRKSSPPSVNSSFIFLPSDEEHEPPIPSDEEHEPPLVDTARPSVESDATDPITDSPKLRGLYGSTNSKNDPEAENPHPVVHRTPSPADRSQRVRSGKCSSPPSIGIASDKLSTRTGQETPSGSPSIAERFNISSSARHYSSADAVHIDAGASPSPFDKSTSGDFRTRHARHSHESSGDTKDANPEGGPFTRRLKQPTKTPVANISAPVKKCASPGVPELHHRGSRSSKTIPSSSCVLPTTTASTPPEAAPTCAPLRESVDRSRLPRESVQARATLPPFSSRSGNTTENFSSPRRSARPTKDTVDTPSKKCSLIAYKSQSSFSGVTKSSFSSPPLPVNALKSPKTKLSSARKVASSAAIPSTAPSQPPSSSRASRSHGIDRMRSEKSMFAANTELPPASPGVQSGGRSSEKRRSSKRSRKTSLSTTLDHIAQPFTPHERRPSTTRSTHKTSRNSSAVSSSNNVPLSRTKAPPASKTDETATAKGAAVKGRSSASAGDTRPLPNEKTAPLPLRISVSDFYTNRPNPLVTSSTADSSSTVCRQDLLNGDAASSAPRTVISQRLFATVAPCSVVDDRLLTKDHVFVFHV